MIYSCGYFSLPFWKTISDSEEEEERGGVCVRAHMLVYVCVKEFSGLIFADTLVEGSM